MAFYPCLIGYAVSRSQAKHHAQHVLTTVVSSIAVSFVGLPDALRYHPELWNPATHGNISFVIVLLLFRFVRQLFKMRFDD